MDSFFGELIKLGAAGLVIWVIAAPLIRYLIDRSREQDTRMAQLIDDHLIKDTERQTKVVAALEHVERNLGNLEKILTAMPQTMMDAAKQVYPPTSDSTTKGNVTINMPSQPVVNGSASVSEVLSEKTKIEGTVKLTPDK